MPLIKPFRGLRPAHGRASDIAAPPYDVLSTAEARVRAKDKPWSFLHISKPEIDLAADTDPYAPEVYTKAATNLKIMLDQGILQRDAADCYYVYRLEMGSHAQTGLVVAASVTDYDSNRIRKHEFTRPDKEDDRVRQIEALNAQTGPVLLAYPDSTQADVLIAKASCGPADADVTADDGIRHTIWVIRDTGIIDELSRIFDAMPALYIADGHHRSAAASRVAAARRKAGQESAASAASDYFIAVIFPHHQMKIMDYNRVIRDLNGFSETEFMARVGERFSIEKSAAAVRPSKPNEFGLYLPSGWYKLIINAPLVPHDDPVARLDVSLLSDNLLGPVLGITDLRRDKRIDFVGGIRGLSELEKRVNSGEMAVSFALHPTQMTDLMAVADAGEVMPPKSTWFEPKLADGLVSHQLD